jgi:hypothetical protein
MIYAVKLIYICLSQVIQYPAILAFSLTPPWYFESLVRSHALKTPLASLSLALSELESLAPHSKRLQNAIHEAHVVISFLFKRSAKKGACGSDVATHTTLVSFHWS